MAEVLKVLYLVEVGEYGECEAFVACADEKIATTIAQLATGASYAVPEPVPYWTGSHVPPHHTLYRATGTLVGPISKHNRHARLVASYETEVHWPWNAYSGWPDIADVAWNSEAKDTEGMRDALAKAHGLNQEVFHIEGYGPDDVYELAQRYLSLTRSRYAIANVLWDGSPAARQVIHGDPEEWPLTHTHTEIRGKHQEKLVTSPDDPSEPLPNRPTYTPIPIEDDAATGSDAIDPPVVPPTDVAASEPERTE